MVTDGVDRAMTGTLEFRGCSVANWDGDILNFSSLLNRDRWFPANPKFALENYHR
jgi:hypothetical protein